MSGLRDFHGVPMVLIVLGMFWDVGDGKTGIGPLQHHPFDAWEKSGGPTGGDDF